MVQAPLLLLRGDGLALRWALLLRALLLRPSRGPRGPAQAQLLPSLLWPLLLGEGLALSPALHPPPGS